MANLYKLSNQIKHYEWGSRELLPQFLGVENREESPWAEMWMGTHPSAPSRVELGENEVNLAELSGELPFLFKLLAVEKPLSIQAHPNLAQARKGFQRENKAGLSLDDPKRCYRDANHKPEIICAISPFTVMAGFREPAQIRRCLETFASAATSLKETFAALLRALEAADALKDFFRALFELSKNERENICGFILENDAEDGDIAIDQWRLMKDFAALYPADAAVISPLFLNLFTLEPGQAVFIPAGILHAYIKGFGAELMANSDNVLRGGLTSKHKDIGELMNILKLEPFMPDIIAPSASEWFRYSAPFDEFSLSRGGGEGVFQSGSICLVTDGELYAEDMTFKKGESFFITAAPNSGSFSFSGNYALLAASGA